MNAFVKILLTPFVILLGLLCGIFSAIYTPIEYTVDFWNDTL